MQKPTIRRNPETKLWIATDCNGTTWPMVMYVNACFIIEIDSRSPDFQEAVRTQNWTKP